MDKTMWSYVLIVIAITSSGLDMAAAGESRLPMANPTGRIEVVATFDGPVLLRRSE